MRIKLRQQTMRLAGAWFLDHLEKYPHLRNVFQPDTLAFMTSLSTRTGERIDVDRAFAGRFATGWRIYFRRHAPEMLFQALPHRDVPASGEAAIAEIVCDITAQLERPKGREPVDPLTAFEANEKHKRSRGRSGAGSTGDLYSHELAAKELGVSRTAISVAIIKGKAAAANIRSVIEVLPQGAEVLFALTDAHERAESGVMAVRVPPRKEAGD